MPRLGDDIDDYCTKCKRSTDHSVAAIAGEEPVKVLCRTCNTEHKYRHNRSGKMEMTTEEAFQKVLASVTGQMSGTNAPSKEKKKKKLS